MKKIQVLARVFYRATTMSMVALMMDKSNIWAIPLSIIISLLTEAEEMSKP